jgi:hypothetical protein
VHTVIPLSIPAWLDLGRAQRGDPWRLAALRNRPRDRGDLGVQISPRPPRSADVVFA